LDLREGTKQNDGEIVTVRSDTQFARYAKFYQRDQVKEGEFGRTCSTRVNDKNCMGPRKFGSENLRER